MNPSFRTRLRLGVSAITMIAAWNAAIAQEPNAPPPVSPGNAPAAPPATQTQPSTTPSAGPPSDATPIPQITVTAPKEAPSAPAKPATTTQRPTGQPAPVRTAPAPAAPARTAPVQTAVPAQTAAQIAAAREAAATRAFTQQVEKANQVRENIFPKTGSDVTQVTSQDISNAPGGANQSISDILVYQFPGVSQDSTSSGDYHVRNDHANVQFRINGIILPDGVSGFAQFLETSFIGRVALLTGALPAQYGLHNTAVLDITSKDFTTNPNSGSVGVYGGTYATVTPTFEYGGKAGQTEYFFAGRGFQNDLGLENPTGNATALHDWDTRVGFFGYTSTYLDESTRITSISGAQTIKYQIPTNPGQQVFPGLFPIYGAPATGADSAKINEVQYEKSAYGVLAWQKSLGDIDMQLAYYTRYNSLLFVPDVYGDIVFNGVASDVYRSSFMNGLQGDNAYKVNDAHTLRFGFNSSVEQAIVRTISTVEPVDATGTATGGPFTFADPSIKTGYLAGVYLQDEWRLTRQLTLNYGARFDDMWQYIDKYQLSPRVNFVYTPLPGTTIHAGYARYFTPPLLTLEAQSNVALYEGTTGAPPSSAQNAILPERSNVWDAGIVQQMLPPCPTTSGGLYDKAPLASVPALNCPGLELGMDAYFKRAQDLLDDGQFGAAYTLTAFNYEKGQVWGVEWKAKFTQGPLTAYGNFSWGREVANTVVSNQSLFAPDELNYIAHQWIDTDHSQTLSANAGLSYLFSDGTRASLNMIYGSGLRAGFANTDHVPAYTTFNFGLQRQIWEHGLFDKPVEGRFDVVNIFDRVYELRSGTGIGVFAPQFGPRRGYYAGISQKL
jgi:outer membrane receptor protein involved in Fe transport